LKLFKSFLNYILIFFFSIIVIELIVRILIFFPTNTNVFKFGFNKNIIFDVVDLSKLQINISNQERKKIKKDILNKDIEPKEFINVWVFGGSTTYGYNCNDSSSWPEELMKVNNRIKIENFAFNGADSDRLLSVLNINIEKKKVPDVIFWASKFNMYNILNKSEYRNKKIMNYDFVNTEKNKFFFNIKQLDKTLKSYLLFYNLFDAIIFRIGLTRNTAIKKEISNKDIEMMVKNFEINTNNAIEIAKLKNVKEFYLISLFTKFNFMKDNNYQFDLYKSYIEKAKEENIGFVKVIDLELDMDSIKDKEDLYLCNGIHQYLEGNVYQANRINEIFWRSSSLTKID
tara:strand:+ start:374 stop:1402 length:1029 start_codon:yes stop_codon:yes gene_type:complete